MMKKNVLFILFALFLIGACANPNPRKPYQGIDYSAYEHPSSKDDFTASLPNPSISGELPTTNPTGDYIPSPDEDFTSEEIASSYGRYTDVTVVAAVKRVKLGANANAKQMALFQQALASAYKKALRTYRPSGFTYSISSVGAVNPLSDIEVNCILGEKAASDMWQATCNLFFQTLVQQYNSLAKEGK